MCLVSTQASPCPVQVALIALTCSTTLRRKHPWNLVALFVFTAIESVLVGMICAYWQTSVVLEAFAVTGAAVAGLTLIALFGKFDVTKKVGAGIALIRLGATGCLLSDGT
jgi:FtsH-binding integral membrane protein